MIKGIIYILLECFFLIISIRAKDKKYTRIYICFLIFSIVLFVICAIFGDVEIKLI